LTGSVIIATKSFCGTDEACERHRMKKPTNGQQAKHRVFVVDDHPIVRNGIVQLINRENDLEVCGEAEDEPQALGAIGKASPDVVLVDLMLQRGDGISLIKQLIEIHPKLPILVLSMHSEALYAARALRAGAKGYLMKREAVEKVLIAIRRVLAGQYYLSDQMQSVLLQAQGKRDENALGSPIEKLSDRELEVFRLLGEGAGSSKIARQLNLSINTVASHRASIKKRLGLKDSTELLQHAIRWVQTQSPG
jgi:DNA-binding NarL/FixJ family response regulator